jgi:hypothetical protein
MGLRFLMFRVEEEHRRLEEEKKALEEDRSKAFESGKALPESVTPSVADPDPVGSGFFRSDPDPDPYPYK